MRGRVASEDTEIAPGDGILAPKSASDENYVSGEHPELASAEGRAIVIGYSRPTDPFRGDVRLARVVRR